MIKVRAAQSNRSGFSIQEVVITLVIIGVLAGLSYPSFVNSVKKATAQEGNAILTIIYDAQRDYAFENAGAYTADITDFEVTFSTPRSFNAPVALDANASCHGSGGVAVLGSITNPGNNGFTLFLRESDGAILCCPTVAANTICQAINYQTAWP